MRIIDRYLGRTVILATGVALLVLVAIDVFFAFLNEVQDIGRGRYGLREVILYVALTVPGRIHELFPVSALLGALLGLGALAAQSELVVLRAAGVSINRIALSVLRAGLLMLVVVVAVGEFVAPPAQHMAENLRATAQSQRVTYRSEYGIWARDGNRFVRILEVFSDGRLGGVEVYETDDRGALRRILQAETAAFDERGWVVYKGRAATLAEDGFSLESFDEMRWDSVLDPELLAVVALEPASLSARDLRRYIGYLRDNRLDTGRYELAFWQRVMAPVAALVMLYVALPFVFVQQRSSGVGQRLLIGILIGLGFYLINQFLGHLGQVYGFPPLASAVLPSALFAAFGGWMLHLRR